MAVGVEAYTREREKELRLKMSLSDSRMSDCASPTLYSLGSPCITPNLSPHPRPSSASSFASPSRTPPPPDLNPQKEQEPKAQFKSANRSSSVFNGGSVNLSNSNYSSSSNKKQGGEEPQGDAAAMAAADVFHAQGFALRKAKNFVAAIDAYTKAINIYPKHFKAHFNRGFAYDKLEMFHEAIADYTRSLEIEPHNAYAYYNRGISRDMNEEYEDAVMDFTKAIELLPTNADFYHNRGFCHRKQGRYQEAVQDYTAALKCEPQHFKAIYNRYDLTLCILSLFFLAHFFLIKKHFLFLMFSGLFPWTSLANMRKLMKTIRVLSRFSPRTRTLIITGGTSGSA